MASFAECGFERARPGEAAHTRQRFGRYQPGAAKDRISLAVADHCGAVDAGNVYRSSSFAVFLSFLVLTG
jgi:hypothetical protein